MTRDLDLAEESVQEAYATALQTWTRDAIPTGPAAGLTTTAKRRAVDATRRDLTFTRGLAVSHSWPRRRRRSR